MEGGAGGSGGGAGGMDMKDMKKELQVCCNTIHFSRVRLTRQRLRYDAFCSIAYLTL